MSRDSLYSEFGTDCSELTAFWGTELGGSLHSSEMLHRKTDLTVGMEETERKIGGRYV